jgi:predicted nucleic acid-binding Zn ribbon protein
MAFCTKCGGSINSSWKHCPTCGSKIEKTSSTPKKKPTKSDTPRSEIKTSPVINGIPPEIQQVLSSSKNYSKFDKPSRKFNEKKFGITVAVILLMVVLILFQLPNDNNSESLPVAETNQQSEESIQAAKELQEDKVNFWSSLNGFKSAGCKPVFTKGENWDMDVTGAQGVKDIASKYAFNTTNQEIWNTIATSHADTTYCGAYTYLLQDTTLPISVSSDGQISVSANGTIRTAVSLELTISL